MTVRTTAALAPGQAANLSISPFAFSIAGPDGITETGLATVATMGCTSENAQLPYRDYSPSSQYAGTIVLDSRHTTGTLVFKPILRTPTGWEWAF